MFRRPQYIPELGLNYNVQGILLGGCLTVKNLWGSLTGDDELVLWRYPFTCSPWSFFERKKILKNQFTFFKKNMLVCWFESIIFTTHMKVAYKKQSDNLQVKSHILVKYTSTPREKVLTNGKYRSTIRKYKGLNRQYLVQI